MVPFITSKVTSSYPLQHSQIFNTVTPVPAIADVLAPVSYSSISQDINKLFYLVLSSLALINEMFIHFISYMFDEVDQLYKETNLKNSVTETHWVTSFM